MTRAPTIVFVDDEPNVLSGLRRATHRKRGVWDLVFVQSGQDVLDILSRGRMDVLVADMRMPGIDGATLIDRVAEISPATIRIILSGESDPELTRRAAARCHWFLAKPLNPAALTEVIESMLEQREHDRLGIEAVGELTDE